MLSVFTFSLLIIHVIALFITLPTIRFKESHYTLPLICASMIILLSEFLFESSYIQVLQLLYVIAFLYFIRGLIAPIPKKAIFVLLALATFGLIASLYSHIIHAITTLILCIYIFYLLKTSITLKHGSILFLSFILVGGTALAIAQYKITTSTQSIIIGLFTVSCTCIIIYNIVVQSQYALQKIRNIARTNLELTKTNRLLKQKNEQYLDMLSRKDAEIQTLSKFSVLAEVTAGIAHEISQPLAGIKSIAQNMIDDIHLGEFSELPAISDLQKICTLVDKATYIIDHIRTFTNNNQKFKLIDLNYVIMNAVTLIHHQLKKSDIEIILNLHDALPKIYGNPINLEQAFLNLLSNAKDAIIEKRKKINTSNEFLGKITVTSLSSNHSVIVTVEDNGIGMQPDIVKHIWSPFFTTKRYKQSLGIGLSISKRIIEDHHGEITIDSTPFEGSKFIITFKIE